MHSPASFLFRIVIVAAVAAMVSVAPKWGSRWVPGAPKDSQTVPAKYSARNAALDKLPTMAFAHGVPSF